VSRRPAPEGSGSEGIRLQHLGFILGTGIFVGFGVATEVAGPGVLLAIALAAMVAACNGLSTAQLATHSNTTGRDEGTGAFPPSLAFVGGWMLVCAKTAAAATAALGLAGYLLMVLQTFDGIWRIPVALATVGILSMPILGGLRRPAGVTTVIAVAVLVGVALLALAGLYGAVTGATDLGAPFAPASWTVAGLAPLSHATAVMLVAYAGLGRSAAESTDTGHQGSAVVPLVIIATTVYLVVGAVGLGTLGPGALARATEETGAPLFDIGRAVVLPGVTTGVAIVAVIALTGMLWNLLFDLARMLDVLGPRGNPTDVFGPADPQQRMPAPAVALSVLAVAGLVLTRDVRVTWSLSAFTLLMYYAIANLAAARLPDGWRRLPRGVALTVLGACLLLAFSLEPAIWQAGLGLLGMGIGWQWLTTRRGHTVRPPPRPVDGSRRAGDTGTRSQR
jgi:APA family basic amino acid/polyamine antiporter